jgi:hypothetical protein
MQEEPNPALQALQGVQGAVAAYLQMKAQKDQIENTKMQRAIDFAKARAEYGEDFTNQFAGGMGGAAKPPITAQVAPAPTRQQIATAPGFNASDLYTDIQNPNGPLPGLGSEATATPSQSTAAAPAVSAPSGPRSITDINEETLAQIKKKSGVRGLKDFRENRAFLTNERESDARLGNITITNESKIRDDYTKASQNFKVVSENIGNIQSIANRPPTAAGDISLIFSYMKLNDPGSTVREGEYATAANAAGIPDRLKALYNRALTGEKLAPAQRADFINTSGSLYEGWRQKQAQTDEFFRGMAERSRVNPENVMVPYGVPNFSQSALAQSPAAAQTAPTGPQPAAPGQVPPAVQSQISQAEAWLAANPGNPKAQAIRERIARLKGS